MIVRYRNDPERPLTDPLPELGGRRFVLRVYSGQFIDKWFGNWFSEPFPRVVFRFMLSFMPFIAWKWPFMNKAGYLGFKLFGVDSDAYREWLPAKYVGEGKLACCFTCRPFATLRR